MSEQRGFSSNFGAIMAAVGSAVGLGNIWRFPYITGKYGGGAFLIVYLLFVFFIGMALMMTEFVIGRRSQHTPLKAFTTICPTKKGWKWFGLFCMVTCFSILSLYLVISGWTIDYVLESASGRLAALDGAGIGSYFDAFAASTARPLIAIAVFLIITAVVILGGVQKGIEAVSKVLMPLLVGLVLILCVRSITMPGASKGLAYLFDADFSKLTGEGVLAALGQALFSLSVGMGTMVVYGSYIPVKDNILKTSMWITVCDTFIAVLAGIAIFPAVFSCGLEPTGGPGLVFKALPVVFNSMGSVGTIFAVIFFTLLTLAALTSAISLLETLVAGVADCTEVKRGRATVIFVICSFAVAVLCSLSCGVMGNVKVAGMTIFDFFDHLNSVYLPPICALITAIFLGWVMPKEDIADELSNHGTIKIGYFKAYRFLIRYVAPVALLVVLVTGIFLSK